MDPGDPDVMKEKPRDPKESFFADGAGLRAIFGGVLIGAITLVAFWYGYHVHGYTPFSRSVPEAIVAYARTMAFLTIVASQLIYSLAFRNSKKSIFQTGVFSNKPLAGAIVIGLLMQGIVIGIPVMRKAFDLEVPDLQGAAVILVLGLVPLGVNEVGKIFLRAKKKKTMS
jgi:Ca2+-transporting ATPase